jgi:LytS/YehU family sensor histidine kinase
MLEQLRMPGQFEYKLTIANIDEPDKIQIPNMMLQPLIENSIRHGINPHCSKNNYFLSFSMTI